METDVRGYYATLGVSPTAPASEIKSAYRRLAKLHHPDSNSSRSDAQIIRVNEAYAVLGDPNRRASYDSVSVGIESTETTQRERIAPLRCSRCYKITAQARYLIFWRVYSIIFATIRTPVQGLFCASCARTEAIHSTTITALIGWWGIPWGPIWTVVCGFKDAKGGEHDKARNEAFSWHNVAAFIQAGQLPVAYGLAERLLSAENKDIRTAASDFMALCRSHGFRPQGELKDSWATVQAQTPVRLAILAFLPLGSVDKGDSQERWVLIQGSF